MANQIFNGKSIANNSAIREKIYDDYPSISYSDRLSWGDVEKIISEAMFYQRVACGRVYRENKNNQGFNEFDLYNAAVTKGDFNGI